MENNMIIIGDVHGKVDNYYKLLQKYKCNSIQLGDFGFKKHHEWHLLNIDSDNHKVLFGNHDYYPMINNPHSLGNWHFDDENSIFTIRGAKSIDIHLRNDGIDWFSNEELTYSEFLPIMDMYEKYKPEIVVTHDCPDYVCKYLFNIYDKSITRQGLDNIFEIHQPKLWLFGHHHKSVSMQIENTTFKCLNELEIHKL